MGAPSFLLGGDVKSSWRRSEWSDWATGDVCIFLFGSWLSVFVYTGNYWTGNLSSRVQAQISEDQWRETGVSERPRACVAHTRKGFMSYSSWRKYKQPQERPGDLRGDTSGGGGGQEEDVTTLQWGKYHLLSIFFFLMTTITTEITSKIEVIEMHANWSRWSEALSEWKGSAVGFQETLLMRLTCPCSYQKKQAPSPSPFCLWIVTHSEDWMVRRRRSVVIATESDGYQGSWNRKVCSGHWGILICVAGCFRCRPELDPASCRPHSLLLKPPSSRQTDKERWTLAWGLGWTLPTAITLAFIIETPVPCS